MIDYTRIGIAVFQGNLLTIMFLCTIQLILLAIEFGVKAFYK